jgi:hypothetical protein
LPVSRRPAARWRDRQRGRQDAEIRQFTSAIATSIKQQKPTQEISGRLRRPHRGPSPSSPCWARFRLHRQYARPADTVLAASQAVERAADSLRGSVDGFLRKVAI